MDYCTCERCSCCGKLVAKPVQPVPQIPAYPWYPNPWYPYEPYRITWAPGAIGYATSNVPVTS